MRTTSSHTIEKARRAAAQESGFSLIEVTLALGLLATVLISIASLFIMGGKQVKNGKSTTTAVALTHEIMERIDQLSYSQIYTWFGGADTSTSLSVPTTTVGNNANQWQAEIAGKLGGQAFGTIAVTPLGGTVLPPTMASSQVLQVQVTVNWSELGRTKTLSLRTLRF